MSGPAPWTDRQRLEAWLAKARVTDAGCWIWTGGRDALGYGRGYTSRQEPGGRRGVMVHRFVYEQLVGQVPDDHVLHHVCETPSCVNPTHVVPMTRADHLDQHPRAPRVITHCIRGHAFDEANTYHGANGHRFCRACGRERANRLWAQGRYSRQRKAA